MKKIKELNNKIFNCQNILIKISGLNDDIKLNFYFCNENDSIELNIDGCLKQKGGMIKTQHHVEKRKKYFANYKQT